MSIPIQALFRTSFFWIRMHKYVEQKKKKKKKKNHSNFAGSRSEKSFMAVPLIVESSFLRSIINAS